MTFFTQSPSPNERDCLESHTLNLEEENILIGHQSYCPRHWDHLLCWPLGKSNATLGIPCNASRSFVEIVLSSRPTIHTEDIPGFAYLYCNSSGIWAEKTNYEECMTFLNEILSEEETRRRVRHAISAITFALCLISTIVLLVALGIFSFFKSLKCDRLQVHKNFMLSLVIRYVVSLVYYEPYIYGNEDPYIWYHVIGRGYLCKLVLVVLMYGQISPIFWMFIEGAYLHSRVVTNIFDSPAPFKFYYFIGWFLPLACTLSWTVTMIVTQKPESHCDPVDEETACKSNHTCWEGYTEQPYIAILSVPMMVALAINLLFLINIVRIVITKVQHQMNASQTETAHIKKAVRATVILFPLLGITNLVFFFNPKSALYEKLYMFFNSILQSSQGIFLAILYCFCNSEVQDTIKRHIRRISTRHDVRRGATINSSRYNRERAGTLSGANPPGPRQSRASSLAVTPKFSSQNGSQHVGFLSRAGTISSDIRPTPINEAEMTLLVEGDSIPPKSNPGFYMSSDTLKTAV
ncbi:hypothetical protein TCAL_00396 [Tigriopus californicus]|uniref:G-protein coupled receptors family 2 profile 2 domain-containing protein n=1 Tax=Tigriopus californicus TaxID=6832 RepID=A0A553NE22_TIGCA|nr:corticotropin-releasing factor receptor 1-like [Tigriopus californicus]XP_059092437.1 corticotropin-releasing factor receptor 1-like [Tigriopus californicus]TRY63693.1 hypothetical protein TCAL_00396 [Tigriopus californicus]